MLKKLSKYIPYVILALTACTLIFASKPYWIAFPIALVPLVMILIIDNEIKRHKSIGNESRKK